MQWFSHFFLPFVLVEWVDPRHPRLPACRAAPWLWLGCPWVGCPWSQRTGGHWCPWPGRDEDHNTNRSEINNSVKVVIFSLAQIWQIRFIMTLELKWPLPKINFKNVINCNTMKWIDEYSDKPDSHLQTSIVTRQWFKWLRAKNSSLGGALNLQM